MPYTMYPAVGAQGPVKPEDPLEALATFLGAMQAGDPAMASHDPALELANLRGTRSDELKTRMANDIGAGDKADFGRSKSFLDMLTADQNADPDTGIAAHEQAAKAEEDAYQQNADLPRQIRGEQRGYELQKAGTPGRVAGEYGLERERIAQSGGIQKQHVANEGLVDAALARSTAGGGGTGTGAGGGGGKLPSGLMERVAGAQTSLKTLDQLDADFPKMHGNINGVGPVSGRLGQFLQHVPLVPESDDFNTFTANSSILANAVIKAITGAQMSEPEAERLMGQIPQVSDKEGVWQQKSAALRTNLNDTINNIQNLNHGTPISPVRLKALAAKYGIQLSDDALVSAMGSQQTAAAQDPDDLGADWGAQ